MNTSSWRRLQPRFALPVAALAVVSLGWIGMNARSAVSLPIAGRGGKPFEPYDGSDASGFASIGPLVRLKSTDRTFAQIAERWKNCGYRLAEEAEKRLKTPGATDAQKIEAQIFRAKCFNYEADPAKAYEVLTEARKLTGNSPELARRHLSTLIYMQGVTSLRMGENDNCVSCRGTSACIIPFNADATHQKQHGSRQALKHFREYLAAFPNDLSAKWLLNLAHMTLGEYPQKVEPKYLVSLDKWVKSEFDIGMFRDISFSVGLGERRNEAGGAILDDFDNDGDLDLVLSVFEPTDNMVFYKNDGKGQFEESTKAAGLIGQLGGLNASQTDYNNDGYLDVFIVRGAWLPDPVRPSLLRNNKNGTFTDVTEQAGLQDPVNSNSAQWADFDNDGHLDVFIACEKQPGHLYRNRGNGTFVEVAGEAGLVDTREQFCKGASWLDYDGDGYYDLFANYLDGNAHLFHNERNGRFTDVSKKMGIDGPQKGFSCWTFDYDNDGRDDIFATCYERTLETVIKGMTGQPHGLQNGDGRLYRNVDGKRFEDATKAAGLNMVFATMGSNFGDFDNDGFLDFYLSTGEPNLATLVPNRMFKNVEGKRFSEITGSSGTGHLQKGHGVACGDWDRDGNVDLFCELGGAIPGDRYHNVLFQNPGQNNHWITLKLVGERTNKAAIGARIKVVVGGSSPRSIHRTVSSGSSFGGNPLQQTIGLGKATVIDSLGIQWPTSRTTQVFRNVVPDRALEIVEFAKAPRDLKWTRIGDFSSGSGTVGHVQTQ